MRRHSRKRDAILNCIRQSRVHPSAEWIYAQLKPEHPDLSLGTVYRNLALFRESGEVVCVATVRGADRLDACTEPHAHFICEQCGAVLDVDVPQDDLRSDLETRYGVRVRRSELLFRGVCSACRETS
ncbi:MAG TPA: transcriptional repressor [Firmicutes bacterium]|nr:transcriptional repressor [Bacillota bacterium]